MTFLAFAELWAAYFAAALVVSLAALVAWVHLHGVPPLLDGSPLRSMLDDSDRRRHLLDVALAEDREVESLDAIWDLPARQHP